jgi:hypothetical protein
MVIGLVCPLKSCVRQENRFHRIGGFFSFHFVGAFRALSTYAEAENKSVSFERHCQGTPLSTDQGTRSIFDEITLAVTAA